MGGTSMSDPTTWRTFDEIHAEYLSDPVVRAEWERTALARAVAHRVIAFRIQHGITQTALARILGMKQPAVSRLELGETNPSWDTLVRLADVLGLEFLIDIAPEDKHTTLVGRDLDRMATDVQRLASRGARVTIATA